MRRLNYIQKNSLNPTFLNNHIFALLYLQINSFIEECSKELIKVEKILFQKEVDIVPVHFVKRFSSDLNICKLCNYLTSIHDKGFKYFVFRGIEGLLNLKQISHWSTKL